MNDNKKIEEKIRKYDDKFNSFENWLDKSNLRVDDKLIRKYKNLKEECELLKEQNLLEFVLIKYKLLGKISKAIKDNKDSRIGVVKQTHQKFLKILLIINIIIFIVYEILMIPLIISFPLFVILVFAPFAVFLPIEALIVFPIILYLERKNINLYVFSGIGTKNNPIIIENPFDLPLEFCLKKSNNYILIKNNKLNLLEFDRCQNVTIESCEFKWLNYRLCSNCIIKNSRIIPNFGFDRCSDMTIDNLEIERFVFIRSNNNHILNCKIERIETIGCHNNIIRNTIAPPEELNKINNNLKNEK